jgi:hypothetical protein
MEVSLRLLNAQKGEIALVLFPAPGELGQLQREQRDIGRSQARLGDAPLATVDEHRDCPEKPQGVGGCEPQPRVDIMRLAGEMKDAGAQLVLQHLDGRKCLQRLRRFVELGRDRIEVRASYARDCVFKKRTQRRTSPRAELAFGIAQRVEHVDRNASTDLARHGPGFIAATEYEELAVIARLWNPGDVGLLSKDIAETRNCRIASRPKIREQREEPEIGVKSAKFR